MQPASSSVAGDRRVPHRVTDPHGPTGRCTEDTTQCSTASNRNKRDPAWKCIGKAVLFADGTRDSVENLAEAKATRAEK